MNLDFDIDKIRKNKIELLDCQIDLILRSLEFYAYTYQFIYPRRHKSESKEENLRIEDKWILNKLDKLVVDVTNHIEKLRKIEKEIQEKEGILIVVTNNKNKSLLKSQIIINMDFNKEVLNQYKIYDEAIILNIEENIKIDSIRFNGVIINDFEVETGRIELIWRENYEKYRVKDLLEANLYARDTFKNIRKKLQKSNISIKSLYGNNGIINL